jgi:hypothetical protein
MDPIKHKYHKTRVSEIRLDEEGIMRIVFAKNVDIDLKDMEEAYAYFGELGFGPGKKKSRQLLSGGPFNISKEARDYAGRSGTDFFIAAAMVTNSIVTRFVINLFNSIQKHGVPFKVFASEEEALKWLRTFSGSAK